MPDDFLQALGMHVQDLIAGFAGGMVNSFVFKKSRPGAIIASILVGGFAANYLAGPVCTAFGITSNTAAFVVGLAGMAICQGIAESASSWSPFRKEEKHD